MQPEPVPADIDLDSLPPPGTPVFFPALLSRIRTINATIPLDSVVLQSILLCVIAGGKHLILRTREEDISLVSRLTVSVLTSVFGYQTNKFKVPKHHHDTVYQSSIEFLQSLFLPASLSSSSSNASRPSSSQRRPRRVSGAHRIPISRSPSSPNPALPHTFSFVPPRRVLTDPLTTTQPMLPKALVVSGLEHAGSPCQRALVRVLSEKRVTLDEEDGIWNIPEGFLLIYVCAADPYERPVIHKSLLDRFAMSATVSLQPAARSALSPRTTSTPTLPIPIPVPPPLRIPILRPSVLTALQARATHVSHTLDTYMADLFSAVRHHPHLDGTLLSARSRHDADALIRAVHILGSEWTGAELIRGVAAGDAVSVTEDGEEEFDEQDIDDVGRIKVGLGFSSSRISVVSTSPGPEVLDVSEADVARIVPRVISHRVRVRAGPAEEVLSSALWGAVNACEENEVQRGTVKDYLVKILAEV